MKHPDCHTCIYLLQLTEGPVLESAPYKTNVAKVLALLKQAEELRIAIIETFMINDDTTCGPSTLSLFIEKIQQFVTTSLQVLFVCLFVSFQIWDMHTVLPNPRFRCPIGLLLTSSPRPAKPYPYFATFGLLLTSWLRNVLKSGAFVKNCQFGGILNLFIVSEQIYRQMMGLRCHTEPLKVIILNFRSWIIYRVSALIFG